MKIKDLKPAEYNPRSITDEKLGMLDKAMREFGDLSGIVFNRRTGRLIGGHQRVKVLDPEWEIKKAKAADDRGTVSQGYIETPFGRWTFREVDWPEQKEKAANIAANQHGGEFIQDALAGMVLELRQSDLDMDLLGFDADELALLQPPKDGNTDPDDIPDIPEDTPPITQPGDLWLLGQHRLLCGDCTIKEDVARVIDIDKVDLLLTDPPYNGGIEYGSGVNDSKTIEQNEAFIHKWFSQFSDVPVKVVTPGAGYYLGTLRSWLTLFPPRWMCIWVRKNSMSHSPLRGYQAWEPMLFYKNEEEDALTNWGGALVYGKVKRPVKQDVFTIPVGVQKDVADEKGNKLHPTPKPRELFLVLIRAFSKEKQIIIEPFAGSGTTIIACEQLDRQCLAIEINARYCDVIVKRWEDYTGQKATRNP